MILNQKDEVAMKKHWAMEFCDLAISKGIKSKIEHVVNGWIETISFSGKKYFTKSATYDLSRRQYFQGVDPSKMNENGDFVLICGGARNILSDIFIIPWSTFFTTLQKGDPVNTYKPPKKYFQYKFYLRDRDYHWMMSVQGGRRPVLDVSGSYYDLSSALEFVERVYE